MNSCSLNEFMLSLKPWLNKDYVRSAFLDQKGCLRLCFVDGGSQSYRIENCSRNELQDVIGMLEDHGINIHDQ